MNLSCNHTDRSLSARATKPFNSKVAKEFEVFKGPEFDFQHPQ